MRSDLLVVSVVGWSESGKTTLISALIEGCVARGIPTGAVKCTRHGGNFEPEGKDSARFRAAGASPVAFVGTGPEALTALFLPTPANPDRAWLEALFPGPGILFSEGLEVAGALRVLVHRGEGQEKRQPVEVDVLVCEEGGVREAWKAAGCRTFSPHETGAMLEYLEELWKGM